MKPSNVSYWNGTICEREKYLNYLIFTISRLTF